MLASALVALMTLRMFDPTILIAPFPRRNNYAAARLQGLEEDLGLNDQQYQTGLSILFVGYVSTSSLAKISKLRSNFTPRS